MTHRTEVPSAGEAEVLRRCVRELTNLSALSAAWSDAEPTAIAESLADALFGILAPDFVYVRVHVLPGPDAHETTRSRAGPTAAHGTQEIAKALEPVLRLGDSERPPTIANPLGRGDVRLAILPLGREGRHGILVVGSQEPDFPGPIDGLLLSVGANQAAVVLQHKRAEQALRESEERFRMLVEGVTDYAIILLDPRGHVVSWNAGAERIKGYEAEEIIGRHFSCFFTAQAVQEGWPARELEIAGTNGTFAEEGWRVRKDGSKFWASATLSALYDERGALRGFAKVTGDLTESRKATETLRSVVDHVVDGIITIDENGTVRSMNPAAERLFGYAESEVVGRNVKVLMPEPYRGEHDGYIANYLRTGEAKIIGKGREVVGLRKDGSTFPMNLAVSAFESNDRRFFTGILRDITARKRREQELKEADRRKDEFLAVLAHELRNPLAPIRNAVDYLMLKDIDDPDVQWARGVIGRQVAQMARLLDDLLDIARIKSGKLTLRTERLELINVLHVAVETSRPLIDTAEQELVVETPPEPIELDGDLNRLAQVVSNLLNNAAKFTARGGRIRLIADRAGGEAVISVRDSGVGIPPEMLPHVFDLFSQVDLPREERQEGLGIGLALTKRLVEMHGGTITAASEGPGKGSEFTVRLPVATGEAAATPTGGSDSGVSPGVSRRILVVDDRPGTAAALGVLLRMFGHEIRTAVDGREALRVAEQFLPDVVLLDIGLPEMSGYDVAQALRRMPEMAGAVLVAITGYGQEVDRARSKEAGFDYHLVKPVDRASLRELLASAAEAGRVPGTGAA